MDKADVWMPLFIGDYIRDTRHLTTEEHGAYFLLIMEYWIKGPLPDCDKYLSTVAGIKASRVSKKTLQTVRAFFQPVDGLLHHKRIDLERQNALENKKKRSSAGRAGAAARWDESDGKRNADAMANGCPSPSSSPSSSPNKKNNKTPYSPPDNSAAGDMGVFNNGFYGNELGGGFDISAYFSDEAFVKQVKAVAPGWDKYHLAGIYNEGVPKRGVPKAPKKAFIGWCKLYTKGNPP